MKHHDQEQRKQHSRLAGKIQWRAHTRPDSRLQAPTQLGYKKLKRMIRHVKGTRHTRCNLRPKIQTQDDRIPINIYTHTHTDASCASWRQQERAQQDACYTSLEQQHTMAAGQAAIAFSSAESELYAIGTAAQESLYISNFIKEAFEVRINIAHRQQRRRYSCDTSSYNGLLRATSSQCTR